MQYCTGTKFLKPSYLQQVKLWNWKEKFIANSCFSWKWFVYGFGSKISHIARQKIIHNSNGQTSSWSPILAGLPQDSILGPLFFLIYIHDLGNNLSSTVKLFANDTSIFSIVHDIDLSSKQLNNDLKKISD